MQLVKDMVHWMGIQETLITMPKWVDNMGLPKRPASISKGRPRKPLLHFRGPAPPNLQVGSTSP
eukprot:5007599-Prorocentrum_lima.AAC.1